jgi:hypothetical protein
MPCPVPHAHWRRKRPCQIPSPGWLIIPLTGPPPPWQGAAIGSAGERASVEARMGNALVGVVKDAYTVGLVEAAEPRPAMMPGLALGHLPLRWQTAVRTVRASDPPQSAQHRCSGADPGVAAGPDRVHGDQSRHRHRDHPHRPTGPVLGAPVPARRRARLGRGSRGRGRNARKGIPLRRRGGPFIRAQGQQVCGAPPVGREGDWAPLVRHAPTDIAFRRRRRPRTRSPAPQAQPWRRAALRRPRPHLRSCISTALGTWGSNGFLDRVILGWSVHEDRASW